MTTPTPVPAAPTVLFDPAAAHQLLGMNLPGDWKVVKKISVPLPSGAMHTGGNFSVGYEAERDGKKGFVKAFDLGGAMMAFPGDIMKAMASVAIDHQYEASLLDICAKASLDKIVNVLAKGQVNVTGAGGFAVPIPFIIFELADEGDFRKVVATSKEIDHAWRLRILHQVAVALQQLHGVAIAHQDVKPSNVLVFKDVEAKLGDLGRASLRNGGTRVAHDELAIAGARLYAPPEQAYGVRAPEWRDRREGCDLYQLGCLICFAFTGTTPTSAYLELPKKILALEWGGEWSGTYETVQPQIAASFSAYLESIHPIFPLWAADDLVTMVGQLCNPDYSKRGAPESRVFATSPLGVDRFITRLDVLAKRATVQVRPK
jgi:serine/threonine protein kinase